MKVFCAVMLLALMATCALVGAQAQTPAVPLSITPSAEPVAVIVQDMERSRQFYAEVLGQKVKVATSTYTTFEKGFSLWQADSASHAIGKQVTSRAGTDGGFEMVFQSAQIEAVQARLEKAQVKFIHVAKEQPWGQRVLRFYDPDGHLVEIGEPMEAVVQRFLKQGMSVEDIVKRTAMPLEAVQQMAKQ